MAMSCGHRATPETKIDRMKHMICPACEVALVPHKQVLPHGFCECCQECWTLMGGEVRFVHHDGY